MSADAMAPLVVSPPPLGSEELPGPQQLDRDCDRAVIEDWVFRAPHVATFLSVVVHRGFLLPRLSLDLAPLVPERHVDQERVFESILDVPSVIYVNAHLPREQRHRWHLLFSSELHGHSFAQLCGRITHQGPCVLLLEDRDGHVFGGFASCSWEVKPQFQGEIWPPTPQAVARGLLRLPASRLLPGDPRAEQGVSGAFFCVLQVRFWMWSGERRRCLMWSGASWVSSVILAAEEGREDRDPDPGFRPGINKPRRVRATGRLGAWAAPARWVSPPRAAPLPGQPVPCPCVCVAASVFPFCPGFSVL